MSVEIANSSEVENKAGLTQDEARIQHNLAHCPACKAKVIMMARTIQTFCYSCGESVTRLDKTGMYYEIRSI